MHLTDADLGAALDPTGGGPKGEAARTHVATCVVCDRAMRSVQAADREVADLLHLLDHPAASLDFAAVRRQATRSDRAPALMEEGEWGGRRAVGPRTALRFVSRRPDAPRPVGTRGGTTIRVAVRRSAIILGLSAAAAAAAVAPHSPVRQLLVRMTEAPRAGHPSAVPIAPAPMSAPIAPAPVNPRGVAIVPAGRVDLVFETEQPIGELHIRSALGTRVAVTASGDGPTYTVGRGTIVIDTRATPGVMYDIELPPPSQLPEVAVHIGSRTVFARHGATVVTQGQLQTDGSYVVAFGH